MRKIILNLAVSLDGFIEGPNGEYDWCLDDQDYGLTDFFDQIDTLLMGRKTYETLRSQGLDHFAEKSKYIVSTKLTEVRPGETILTGDFLEEIRKMKAAPGKDIWLFGGAHLTNALFKERLINEFQLSIHPLLLGDGTRLFRKMDTRMPMELTDCKKYDSGLVQLFYNPKY